MRAPRGRDFAVLAISLAAAAAAPSVSRADEPRTVDFIGGFSYTQALHECLTPAPGLGFAVRWLSPRGLWIAGTTSYTPSLDLRNAERGELSSLVTVGSGIGPWWRLGESVSLHAGVRLDLVATDGGAEDHAVPVGLRAAADTTGSAVTFGVRAGPAASLALVAGHVFGHPMMLEVEANAWRYRMASGGDATIFGGGLYLTGVLFPDR
jgi:hypothetical protein